MNEFVFLVFSLSISGSILALLLFAIKPLIKHRVSKLAQYLIWIVVILRLALPFSFGESIMKELLYNDISPVIINATQMQEGSEQFYAPPEKVDNRMMGPLNKAIYSESPLSNFISQYALYLWIIGVLVAFTFNLTGYLRFSKYLRRANIPATQEENLILALILNGQKNVSLVRNPYATTPMLVGFFRPCIIIPNSVYDENQMKYILLHEMTHFRRKDIAIKWMTMIATSIHWFNPLMYFIKREINYICELACDETVIEKLNACEKQAYGETLIAVVANNKYPIGLLQATMSEEKNTLKERLVSIMKHSKKSTPLIIVSVLLLVGVIGGAIVLGASNGKINNEITYGAYIDENEKGFSLTLPKKFANDVQIVEEGNIVYFVNKELQAASPEMIFGVVGRIELYSKNEFTRENLTEMEDIYGLKYLGENDTYYFGAAHATDIQLMPDSSEQLKKRFKEMEEEFNLILESFTVREPNQTNSVNSTKAVLGLIKNYDRKTDIVSFAQVEWIVLEDKKRIEELQLDVETDFTNGHFIYNESKDINTLKINKDTIINLVDWDANGSVHKVTDQDGFAERVSEYETVFQIEYKDDSIIELMEKYRP